MPTILFADFSDPIMHEIQYRVGAAACWRREVRDHRAVQARRAEMTSAWEAAVARRRPRPLTGAARIARLPAAHLPDSILDAGVLTGDTPVRWVGGSPQWGEGLLIEPIPAGTRIEVTARPRRADAGAVTLTYPEGTPGPMDWASTEDQSLDRRYSCTEPRKGVDWDRRGAQVDALTAEENAILDAIEEWRITARRAVWEGIPADCPVLAGLI